MPSRWRSRAIGSEPMKHTYRALDGLRFFAAFAVVLYHYAPSMNSFFKFPIFTRNLVEAGPAALGFFYILSGFVLTNAYRNRFPATAATKRTFWLTRVARLYPVYLLAFVMFGPIAYVKYLADPHGIKAGINYFLCAGLVNLFAMQAWTPFSNSWNGPSWSLSVEAFFYFLFPFLIKPMIQSPSKALIAFLGLGWLAMNGILLARLHGAISYTIWHDWIQYSPLFWLPMFVNGIAAARLTSFWSNVSSRLAATVATLAVLSLILLCGLAPPDGMAQFIVYGGSAPLLTLIILAFTHPTAISSRIMSTPLLAEAGAVSYVTYILQAPLWHGFIAITNHFRHVPVEHSTAYWQLGAYLSLLLAVSFAVRDVIERPAQRWVIRKFVNAPAD